MARSAPRRPETSTVTSEAAASAEDAQRDAGTTPPEAGGSPGLPEGDATLDPNLHRAEQRIPGVPFRAEAPRLAEGEAKPTGPVARRYKVTGGPQHVAIKGAGLCKFYFGKEVCEKDYDVENLRRQGVQLQEIVSASTAAA